MSDIERAVEGGAENIAANQAAFAESQAGGDVAPDFCHGPYSYWWNAVRMGPSGGSQEVRHMFPEGWSAPNDPETRTSTLRQNAEAGDWLLLFIPEGCDGYLGAVDPETGDLLPEIVFFTNEGGKAAVLAAADKYAKAVELGLESATYTSGSPYVREV